MPVALEGVGFTACGAADEACEAAVAAGVAADPLVDGAAVAAGALVGACVGAGALVAAGAVVGDAGVDWEHAADKSAAPRPSVPARMRRREARYPVIPWLINEASFLIVARFTV